MRVIKDRQIVDDDWVLLAADSALPATGDVIVSLSQWNEASQAGGFAGRAGKVGVRLKSNESPEQIQALEQAPLIAIEFPSFTDGRGYTSARLLRDRHGYRGELRAVGDVLRDQLFYMARCGIDSFALKAGKDIEGALSAFLDFSITYQAAADDRRPLFRRVSR
ncbi:MAG: DUF934 domain-containing protein [Deltaproteobacteria bacterium]